MESPLIDQLKFEEGFRVSVYLCSRGVRTIGYGHSLEARPWFKGAEIPSTITRETAEELLESDVIKTRRDLVRAWPQITLLSPARIDACVNMAFQLGVEGLMQFKKMRYELISGHWKNAQKEALNSDWAKQTPNRAKRVAGQLLSGEYYEIPH